MEKDKRLNFKTYEEAADWFDTHDMTEYETQMQPVDSQFWFEEKSWLGRIRQRDCKKR